MLSFFDSVGNVVELSFSQDSFQQETRHVLVLPVTDSGWLLTNHKVRGLEFPGGKVEAGETVEEAARREVFEETGAILGELEWLAEYRVNDPKAPFVKAVFWGKVKNIAEKNNYLETNGPEIIKGDLLKLRHGKEYSFIMKDRVIEECIKKMKE